MSNSLPVRFTKLTDDAYTPTYATDGSAALDFYACDCEATYFVGEGRPHTIPTGIAIEIPEGHAMLLFSRSGHGFNSRVRLGNCVGVIDSDYRGEIAINLTADIGGGLAIKRGDRIAQGMIVAAPKVSLIEMDALATTGRGAGGFGSTGA